MPRYTKGKGENGIKRAQETIDKLQLRVRGGSGAAHKGAGAKGSLVTFSGPRAPAHRFLLLRCICIRTHQPLHESRTLRRVATRRPLAIFFLALLKEVDR